MSKERVIDPKTGLPPTKLSLLRSCAASGDWTGALRIASKFGNLGSERNAILSAWGAIRSPDFCRQIGKDPDAAIAEGIAALRRRYSI